jgi:fermentation-respiration switch protein FrsA (DUF1100 family)
VVIAIGAAAAFLAVWNLASPERSVVGAAPADLPARDIEFVSHGATLRGWFVSAEGHRGVIVLLHGVRGNRSQMADRARFLHRAGYAVLLFDSRAHGESGGDAITFGHLESEDARAAVTLARSLARGERVGAIGVSLGGAAILLANPPLDVDAMVLESVYPSIDHAIEDRLRWRAGFLAPVFAPALESMIPVRLGFRAGELRPIDHVSKLTPAKFFLFGTADRDTTVEESMELFNTAAEPKQMWAVEGAAHVDLCSFAPQEYERRVLEFLSRWVR